MKWYEKNELNGPVLFFLMLTTTKWFLLLRNAVCVSWVACTFQLNHLYMLLLLAELRDTISSAKLCTLHLLSKKETILKYCNLKSHSLQFDTENAFE